MRFEGSEVEPDLMVRQAPAGRGGPWDAAPTPMLVVEILSPYTRRRDHMQKRSLYMDAGVAEYWIVNPEEDTITSVRAGQPDVVSSDRLVWAPPGTAATLTIDVAPVFGESG